MSLHLRTANDVKNKRKELLELQKGCCKISGAFLEFSDSVLDHDHDSQLVRGVIHRQSNAMLGKIEGAYKRMMKWWCPIELPRLLRMYAYYLDKCEEEPNETYHPGWIKKSKTEFNKLNSKAQIELLGIFNIKEAGKNGNQRKENWSKLLASKTVAFDEVKEELDFVNLKTKRGIYD